MERRPEMIQDEVFKLRTQRPPDGGSIRSLPYNTSATNEHIKGTRNSNDPRNYITESTNDPHSRFSSFSSQSFDVFLHDSKPGRIIDPPLDRHLNVKTGSILDIGSAGQTPTIEKKQKFLDPSLDPGTQYQQVVLNPSSKIKVSGTGANMIQPTQSFVHDTNSSVISESSDRSHRNATKAVVKKIFKAAQSRRQKIQQSSNYTHAVSNEEIENNAAVFARDSSKAGFLQKLGTNVKHYKRRFFVLKPTTYLYYFLSPNDIEPRGCIDLENTTISDMQTLPDGRFRFKINNNLFSHNSNLSATSSSQSILLEARNETIGSEWVKCLQQEKLSYVKEELNAKQTTIEHQTSTIDSFKKQIDEYRLVETDRDGALQEVKEWKNKFNKLNEAITLLTRHIKIRHDGDSNESKHSDDGSQLLEENKNSSFASITEEQRKLDKLNVSECNFSSLYNACQMLLENVKLTSKESDSTEEELRAANQSLKENEKKIIKVEKLVCKLWEENCAMRDAIKQIKKEKKVLVNEVKSLMKVVEEKDEIIQKNQFKDRNSEESLLIQELEEHLASTMRLHEQFRAANTGRSHNQMENIKNSKRESAPIYERKESQSTTTTSVNETQNIVKVEDQEYPESADETYLADATTDLNELNLNETFSPLRPTRLVLSQQAKSDNESLTSDVSSVQLQPHDRNDRHEDLNDEEAQVPEENETNSKSDTNCRVTSDEDQSDSTIQPSYPTQTNISATTSQESNFTSDQGNINSKDEETQIDSKTSQHCDANTEEESRSSSSNDVSRVHPLDRLNVDDDGDSSIKTSSRSVITDNGQATAKLVCPLNDVGSVDSSDVDSKKDEEVEVYHLTFYGKKIGLQFQKVPISSKTGILNDAMTTDVHGLDSRHGRTAAELRRISSISDIAGNSNQRGQIEQCKVATPIDAVLVCGFHGFDDDSNSKRPKLGARLVAFDGVSVEIGRWTFESVKRAIQARGRPLTLSFRNDYLTSQQREILTKAVNDVTISRSRYPPKIHQNQSVPYHLQGSHFSHNTDNRYNISSRSDLNRTDLSPYHRNRNNVQYQTAQAYGNSTPNSVHSYQSYRSGISSFSSPSYGVSSFSDAGSSNILSTTIGPLVAGLMNGLAPPEAKQTPYPPHPPHPPPEYLQGEARSLDNIPHHHDFKAGLL